MLQIDKLIGELVGTIHDDREVADKKSVVGICPDCNKALVLRKQTKDALLVVQDILHVNILILFQKQGH